MFQFINKLSRHCVLIQKYSCYCTLSQSNKIDKEKLIKILTLEIDVMRHDGRKVPDPESMKPQHWEQVLSLNSKSARQKYYTFLWTNEKKKESAQIKKAKQKEFIEQRKLSYIEQNKNENHIIYGLMHTTFLIRIADSTMNLWNNNKYENPFQFIKFLILIIF